MRQFPKRKTMISALLIIITLSGCQCGNKPTEPEPVDKDYPIYFSNYFGVGDKVLFKYYPDSQKIDSALIPWTPKRGISVSANGKLLYLSLDASVVVIDAESFEIVQELPYKTGYAVAVSPDNKLIAITGDTLRILRTSDYQVIYSDTLTTYRGIFSKDNLTFFCGFYDSVNSGSAYILTINETQFIKTTKSFPDRSVGTLIPTSDKTKWILYNLIGSYCAAFDIYDIALDSIIFTDTLCPGGGTATLSADEKKVYYTAPGSPFQGANSPFIKVFDLETNMIETIIDSTIFYADSFAWALPNDVIATPDNRYLGVLNGVMALSVFHLIDLQTLTVVDRRDYGPNGYGFTQMTMQNK